MHAQNADRSNGELCQVYSITLDYLDLIFLYTAGNASQLITWITAGKLFLCLEMDPTKKVNLGSL